MSTILGPDGEPFDPAYHLADDSDDDDDGELITCWCGVRGTIDELFDWDCLDDGCGGTGHVYCYCGGDLCVCHHHGQEVECPGCDECRGDEPDDWDNGYPEDDVKADQESGR